jgi:hypothetical protein
MAGELYITPSELVLYYDQRRVLQLASDTGTPAVLSDLSNSNSTPYINLRQKIRAVCSDIDSKCQQGQRYDRADLEAIIAAATANPTDESVQKRAGVLKQLTADLTYGRLNASRGIGAEELTKLCPRYEEAEAMLEQLYQGSRIFDIDKAKTSGIPGQITINRTGPSFTRYNDMFFVPDDPRTTLGQDW